MQEQHESQSFENRKLTILKLKLFVPNKHPKVSFWVTI